MMNRILIILFLFYSCISEHPAHFGPHKYYQCDSFVFDGQVYRVFKCWKDSCGKIDTFPKLKVE